MKHYNQPETNVLQVVNSSVICTSAGPAPAPGQILNASQKKIEWKKN